MTKHRRHSRKRTRRSTHRRRRTYKHLRGGGGTCFGNGVGSNHVDPNYSIYNTRALQLFPYRAANGPTNPSV